MAGSDDDVQLSEEDPSEEYQEEEDDEDDEDYEEQAKPRSKATPSRKRLANKSNKRERSRFLDDAAEEDDLEDEDYDQRKKHKTSKARAFIDEEADVDEDEDEDEVDEADGDLIDDAGEVHEEPTDAFRYREIDLRRREAEEEPSYNEAYFRERYAGAAFSRDADEDTGEDGVGMVGQQGLLPTARDPKLWLVECVTGSEREAVLSLMKKARAMAAKGTPLEIKSVFCQDHLKGFLYIEAFKETHVREATRGLRIIRNSKDPHMVPLREMAESITVNLAAKAPIDIGSWVRMKGGVYKADLAKVVDIEHGTGRLVVKLVPRLDYAVLAKEVPGTAFGQAAGRARPPAKPFDVEEAKNRLQRAGIRVDHGGQSPYGGRESMFNSFVFCDGHLIRKVLPSSVVEEGAALPLEEIAKWNQAGGGKASGGRPGMDDLQQLVASLPEQYLQSNRGFVKGDRVRVVSGELGGLTGVVVGITNDDRVEVKADLKELTDVLVLDPAEITKSFQKGDHVKVASGPAQGQTGLVVKVEDHICWVFTDTGKEEVQVFARDLVEAAAAETTGVQSFGQYDLHDVVQLDNAVGVVVGVEKDSCQVLTNMGQPGNPNVRTCKAGDIRRRFDMGQIRRNITQDRNNVPVHYNDIVTVVSPGPLLNKTGTVKAIMHGSLFLYNREWLDHAGMVSVSSRNVVARGGGSNAMAPPPSRSGGVFAGLRSPAPHRDAGPMGPSNGMGGPFGGGLAYGSTGPSFGGPSFQPPPAAGRSFSGRAAGARIDNSIVGRRIKIARGQFRGYQGRVVGATDTHVRVELEAQQKIVSIKRELLDPAAPGAARPMHTAPATGSTGYVPPMTPMHAAGGRTPMHPGSATPAHAWGSATPAHPSQTPGRDAWNPSFATPRHPSQDEDLGYGYANADTPGLASAPSGAYRAAPTPGNYTAPTPGGFAAPTPGGYGGGYGSAPTPGGGLGMTPGVAPTPGMAPTPGLAPTPGMLEAATPALGGMDYGGGLDTTHWIDCVVELAEGRHGVVVATDPLAHTVRVVGATCSTEGTWQRGAGEVETVPSADVQLVRATAKNQAVKVTTTGALGVVTTLLVDEVVVTEDNGGVTITSKLNVAVVA